MYMRQKYRQRKSDEDLLVDALRRAMGCVPGAGDEALQSLLNRLREGEKGQKDPENRS